MLHLAASYLDNAPRTMTEFPDNLVILILGALLMAVLWGAQSPRDRSRLPAVVLASALALSGCTAAPCSPVGVWSSADPATPIQVILESDGTARVIFGTETFTVRK